MISDVFGLNLFPIMGRCRGALVLFLLGPPRLLASRRSRRKAASVMHHPTFFDLARASAPLFALPDGSSSILMPTIIYDDLSKSWVAIFSHAEEGARSQLSLSSSADKGRTWQYHGQLALPPPSSSSSLDVVLPTLHGPHVFWWSDRTKDPRKNRNGSFKGFHLFVTSTSASSKSGRTTSSRIAHFFSRELLAGTPWEFRGYVAEAGARASDPFLVRLPSSGLFKLFFCDASRTRGETAALVGSDLATWERQPSPELPATDNYDAAVASPSSFFGPHSRPVCFALGGSWWLLVEPLWERGLVAFKATASDADVQRGIFGWRRQQQQQLQQAETPPTTTTTYQRQPPLRHRQQHHLNLLARPGLRDRDAGEGTRATAVAAGGGRFMLLYVAKPAVVGRGGGGGKAGGGVQVAELAVEEETGFLVCRRDQFASAWAKSNRRRAPYVASAVVEKDLRTRRGGKVEARMMAKKLEEAASAAAVSATEEALQRREEAALRRRERGRRERERSTRLFENFIRSERFVGGN